MKYEITRFSCFLEFHIEQKWELYGNVMLVGISYPVIFEWRNCSVHCYSTCFAVLSMAIRCQYMNKNNTWTRYLLEALTVNQCKASSSFLTYNAASNRIMKLHTVHLQHPASHQTL